MRFCLNDQDEWQEVDGAWDNRKFVSSVLELSTKNKRWTRELIAWYNEYVTSLHLGTVCHTLIPYYPRNAFGVCMSTSSASAPNPNSAWMRIMANECEDDEEGHQGESI